MMRERYFSQFYKELQVKMMYTVSACLHFGDTFLGDFNIRADSCVKRSSSSSSSVFDPSSFLK